MNTTEKPGWLAKTWGWVRERISKAAEKAAENLVLLLIALAIGLGGTLFGALRGALSYRPVWITLCAIVTLLALGGLLVGLVSRSRRQRRLLEARVRSLEDDVKTAEYAKGLMYDALESVQQELAKEEIWNVDDLAERGILGPMRGLLTRGRFEDVRLSVLEPREDGRRWRMRWAAGHRPESVRGYDREIDKTLAGLAFRSGDFVQSEDVEADDRFEPHPRATRPFHSLVAAPLRIGDDIVGVFSVISTLPNAFSESDISFIKAIGAILDLLLALEFDDARNDENGG